jgi:GH15 family glucan-1,4-alpha-glucosidase
VRGPGTGALRRRPEGQIVASLPFGVWNIMWARDLVYATLVLRVAGRGAAPTAALRFVLDGDAGEYASYVGRDYLVSVTRYFGGGREESDVNAGGPNIEWDDFGSFLLTFARALDDGLPVDDRVSDVKAGVADVLLSLVGDDGLLVPDSSIWETHWEPSFESQGRQQFTYSSAMASAGLRAFGDALARRGDVDAARYRAAGDALATAIAARLVDARGVLAACSEELTAGGAYLDAAVVEAFNTDVVRDDATIAATLEALEALRAPTGGFIRNDAGGTYDTQEWIVVDLWMSKALRHAGRVADADALLAHVTQIGLEELGLLPELLDGNGRAAGAFPMMGFGAGAYLSALVDRSNASASDGGSGEGEGEGEKEGEGEGESGEGEGEGEGESDGARDGDNDGALVVEQAPRATPRAGCSSTTAVAPASWLPLAAGLAFARRRRSRR